MNDISIDIESLGTKYNAPILSIGAVLFDRETGETGKTFYQEITLASCVKHCELDGDTLAWWLSEQRSVPAKAMFAKDSHENPRKMHLASALQNFCSFVRGVGVGAPRVWGNGATFDITIIEHSLNVGTVGLSPPWAYVNVRDLRTLVDAAESIAGFQQSTVKPVGVHHNALDDAIYQANVAHACWVALGGGKSKKAKPAVKSVTPAPAAQSTADEW